MDYLKRNHLSILIILFLMVSSVMNGSTSGLLGVAANVTSVTNPWKFGPNGSEISELKATTCTLTQTALARYPLATTTVPFDCAVTGLTSADVIVGAHLASDGGSLAAGTFPILVTYAKASTTAGIAEIGLAHPTDGIGAAATSSFALATTSFQITYIDN